MEILLEKGLSEKERQEIRTQIEEKYNTQYDLPDLRGQAGIRYLNRQLRSMNKLN